MPQVKKREMRQAILDGSYLLFRKQGYYQTTLRQIAREAGTSLANVYVYFASKYEIVFEIYDPWMTAKITQLEREAARIKHPDTASGTFCSRYGVTSLPPIMGLPATSCRHCRWRAAPSNTILR